MISPAPKPARQERKPRRPIKRSAIKKRRPSKAETERVYGSKAFRDWLHRLPCQLCGVVGFTQQAHVGKHPMGKKLGWQSTTALCGPFMLEKYRMHVGCHQKFDQKMLTPDQVERVKSSVLAVQMEWARISGTALADVESSVTVQT